MKPDADTVLVLIEGGRAFARIVGRGSFKVSGSLKEFGTRISNQPGVRLIVDLSQCVSMDSTFMGVLAGLSFQFRKQQGARIQLVNVTPKLQGLIATLGLNHLVDSVPEGSLPAEYAAALAPRQPDLEELPAGRNDKENVARIMLEAHENLVQASQDNIARFKDVIAFLREDLKKN